MPCIVCYDLLSTPPLISGRLCCYRWLHLSVAWTFRRTPGVQSKEKNSSTHPTPTQCWNFWGKVAKCWMVGLYRQGNSPGWWQQPGPMPRSAPRVGRRSIGPGCCHQPGPLPRINRDRWPCTAELGPLPCRWRHWSQFWNEPGPMAGPKGGLSTSVSKGGSAFSLAPLLISLCLLHYTQPSLDSV